MNEKYTLSPLEELLIKFLKIMGVEEDEMIGIMVLLDKQEQREELVYWIKDKQNATSSDILGQALKISEQPQ